MELPGTGGQARRKVMGVQGGRLALVGAFEKAVKSHREFLSVL